MGSVISAADDSMEHAFRAPRAADSGIRPDTIINLLRRGVKSEDVEFSTRLLQVGSDVAVDDLLKAFRIFEPSKQQSTITAIVVMAIGTLERAAAVDQTVLWTTARLANFLLGNCLLPATHVWLDRDPQRFTYLRNASTAQSVVDGRINPFLTTLSERFMAGAKAFGQTYCDSYDFILAQEALDRGHIFGDVKCIPTAVDTFSRAVAKNWAPVVVDLSEVAGAVEEVAGRDDEDRHSATGSTSTVGTIATGAVLRTLQSLRFADEAVSFVGRLFADPSASTPVSLDVLLGQYAGLGEAIRSDILKAAIVQALVFLDGADVGRNLQALWVTARLSGFLLGNRLLLPFHGWLDGVNVGIPDDHMPLNVSALVYLVHPTDGMLPTAMHRLATRELPQEEPDSTNISDLSKFFKSIAAEFDGAYREMDNMSKVQFRQDRAGSRTRTRPNVLEILERAVQMALDAQERASEAARDRDDMSPLRVTRVAALEDDGHDARRVVRTRPLDLRGVDGLVPNTSSDPTARLLVAAHSVNTDADEDEPKRCWLARLCCWCC